MSTFLCACGHRISDTMCPNECTGDILSDKSKEVYFNRLPEVVSECFEYSKNGSIDDWIKDHFNSGYPKDLPIGEMVHDVLRSEFNDLTLAIMECDKCGSIWMQREIGSDKYVEYKPQTDKRIKVLGFNRARDPG